jgi:hypothetical protein
VLKEWHLARKASFPSRVGKWPTIDCLRWIASTIIVSDPEQIHFDYGMLPRSLARFPGPTLVGHIRRRFSRIQDKGSHLMASDTFKVGDLTAIIGDNGTEGEHRAGYNGLWSLTHKTQEQNLFVPAVAGMNLEHIYDGQTLDPPGQTKLFFEAPMNFQAALGQLR